MPGVSNAMIEAAISNGFLFRPKGEKGKAGFSLKEINSGVDKMLADIRIKAENATDGSQKEKRAAGMKALNAAKARWK